MATLAVDGVDLYYREAGEGPPLLLIHGGGPNADSWRATFDDLARDFRVIAYDRRGFSRSVHEPVADWQRHSDDAAALLRELDAVPAGVVGWSSGSIVALDLATRHPELVSSIVLTEPALHARKNVTGAMMRTFLAMQVARRVKGDRAAADRWFRWVTSHADGSESSWDAPANTAERKESMLANASACFRGDLKADDSHLTPELLGRIDVPITVLVGANTNPWFDKLGRHAVDVMPRARLEKVEGGSHAMTLEAPTAFAGAIRRAVGASEKAQTSS